jgi:transcriptional regulator with XRE-family HTH domain
MTGKELKLRRIGLDVKAVDLAERMGTTSSQVSRVENSRLVTDRMTERYLGALATFVTVTTPESPVEAA